jgi:predicted metalloprotease with PDZ domain
MTGLDDAPDGKASHFRAADYETLIDSPIMAGDLRVTEFVVDGKKHFVVGGGIAQWDSATTTRELLGFLLDARIRRATGGRKSFDDVMRLAYQRYAGARGYTADQFRATAEEIAGADLKDWFQKSVSSTEELDYTEALDWFGLRFVTPDDPTGKWSLEVRPDVTPAQQEHLRDWLRPSSAR